MFCVSPMPGSGSPTSYVVGFVCESMFSELIHHHSLSLLCIISLLYVDKCNTNKMAFYVVSQYLLCTYNDRLIWFSAMLMTTFDIHDFIFHLHRDSFLLYRPGSGSDYLFCLQRTVFNY